MSSQPVAVPSRPNVTERRLTLLIGLGVVASLWALFQWGELLVARAGGESFCAISATFDCAAVWDSNFASTVHSATGLPVAAWGLVWGMVAWLMPLWGLMLRAGQRAETSAWLATQWTAAFGLIAVVVMAIAALGTGRMCITCLATYVLVVGYGVVALGALNVSALRGARTGFVSALVCTVAVYLVLLVPGLRTPHSKERVSLAGAPTASAPIGTPRSDDSVLAGFLAQLSPPARQALSDSLAVMAQTPNVPLRPPRVLLGSPTAAVRITHFTDVLCGHCATLHETLAELRRVVPPELLAIESRQFPLDGGCNSYLQAPPSHPERCLAARAQICLEQDARGTEFSAALFAHQEGLTEARIYELATPYIERTALQACVRSPETEAKLREDLAWAMAFGIDGTPLVLVNGRQATSFGPFLYAMALTGGQANHPLFAGLPPPQLQGHVH